MNFYDQVDFYCHKCAIQSGENIFLASAPVDSVSFNVRNLNLGGKISDNVWCLIVRRGDLGDPSWHILFMLSLVVLLAGRLRVCRAANRNISSQSTHPERTSGQTSSAWLSPAQFRARPGLTSSSQALSISHLVLAGPIYNYQNEILTKLRLQVHQFDIQWKYDWCRGEPGEPPYEHTTPHHTTPHHNEKQSNIKAWQAGLGADQGENAPREERCRNNNVEASRASWALQMYPERKISRMKVLRDLLGSSS